MTVTGQSSLVKKDAVSIIPPHRFAWVHEGLCRGGWPKDRNKFFLQGLGLNTILSLTPTPLDAAMEDWARARKITLLHVKVDSPKEDNVPLTFQKVIQIIQIMIDVSNLPLYVHCLDGTVTTSIAIASLRKVGSRLASDI
ncbi:hypothetical protein HDU91_003195 [Kappamyces sp. JEL0680]|nr:hypothetical protein HDU91_003195 [Kappamyces sp. JEL0680]